MCTIDQDSVFTKENIQKIKNYIKENESNLKEDTGIVAPFISYNGELPKNDKIIEKKNNEKRIEIKKNEKRIEKIDKERQIKLKELELSQYNDPELSDLAIGVMFVE